MDADDCLDEPSIRPPGESRVTLERGEGLPDLLVSLARSQSENEARVASTRKTTALVLAATLAAALMAATILWLGGGDTATGAGDQKNVRLDPKPMPQVTVAEIEPPKADAAAPAAPADPPAASPPPESLGARGSVIQLGAYQNQAQAERAWTALSARFPSVAAMGKLIIPFPGGMRLRAAAASPAKAKQACRALKAAGENCFVAQ